MIYKMTKLMKSQINGDSGAMRLVSIFVLISHDFQVIASRAF